ncbi:hypothetical protein SISNIDRAFT_119489 [Sistotremastrum niveocremeum HHB9708]|uniref:Uncharacterized protein n=2 Tax=Sistotremastraceae TaxID=3402574 RepID=A0A164TQK9_9AGAM|nr:hypothetical protein SISNIDRAFT_119489 [Sistotremastrum niveocremeum HHB9708]KZT42227.1 hypothetical protein SISSUDRAFT_114599 [Sistotremastrum suecicum HHB10207 ss-3]
MSHLAASDAESAIRKTPTKIPSSSSSYSTSRNSQYGSLSRTSTSSITSADSLGHEHHLKKQPSFDSSTRSPSRTSTHQRSTLPPKSPRHKTPVNSPSKQLPTPSKPDASQALSPVRAKTNDAHRAAKVGLHY